MPMAKNTTKRVKRTPRLVAMVGGYWMRLCCMFGFISQDLLGNGRGRKVFTFVGVLEVRD